MAGVPAARITDTTADGGLIIGPGEATVLIGGLPASIAGDSLTWPTGASAGTPTAAFTIGSTTVLIGKKPAIRVGDMSTGGTSAIIGKPTVLIG